MSTVDKNPGNVIGGHKAAINNPNVSEEAKEHSQRVLEEYPETTTSANQSETSEGKNEGNFIGGHKAAINNPRVSEEAKEHSREVLEEHGVDV